MTLLTKGLPSLGDSPELPLEDEGDPQIEDALNDDGVGDKRFAETIMGARCALGLTTSESDPSDRPEILKS